METETKLEQPEVCNICGCTTAPDVDGIWFCTNPFCNNYPRDGRQLLDEGWYREHLVIRGPLDDM